MIEHRWRVTHYDPALRDGQGAYQGDSWTSCADVGGTFAGVELTWERYLEQENAHVESALEFLMETGSRALRVVGLEDHGGGREVLRSVALPALSEGALLRGRELAALVRGLLREQVWCRLEAPGFYLHVGYDYYLYLGASQPCPHSVASARSRGLFVETFPSPYEA